MTEKQHEIASETVAAVVKTAVENGYSADELGKIAEATAQALVKGYEALIPVSHK